MLLHHKPLGYMTLQKHGMCSTIFSRRRHIISVICTLVLTKRKLALISSEAKDAHRTQAVCNTSLRAKNSLYLAHQCKVLLSAMIKINKVNATCSSYSEYTTKAYAMYAFAHIASLNRRLSNIFSSLVLHGLPQKPLS